MTALEPPIAQAPSEDINHHTNIQSVDDEPDHDHILAEKAQAMSLHERPASRATTRTTRTNRTAAKNPSEYVNGGDYAGDEVNGHEGLNHNDYQNEGVLHNAEPSEFQSESRYDDEEPVQRPPLRDTPSRSYVHPIPIVTTYEPDLPDSSANRRRSVAGSTKAPSIKAASVRAPTVREDVVAPAQSTRAPSVKRSTSRAGSVRSNKAGTGAVYGGEHRRAPSVAGSARHLPQLSEDEGRNTAGVGSGFAVGEIASEQRQRDLQHTNGNSGRHSLQDQGSLPRDRSTTFSEPQRATSPRPHSSFGHRPQPNLLSITENDRPESRADGGGGGNLGRSNTVLSRAGTLGRNGNLSRAANGGTVGSRRGAFGRGAGASIGTQPEEVLGRDDIHTRAELSERILDEATLRRLSTMEKKDARRLAKVIKTEAKSETAAVRGSIKELERLVKLQRQAASTERKSQSRLAKWTSKEHRARLRFLKEKERYERIEGELRNAENDYEERRDHAAGLTAQVAEKTQDLDDLRAQKAADDREREVKLLALKNPAHS